MLAATKEQSLKREKKMPDLSRVTYYFCISLDHWSAKINGSTGNVYTIEFHKGFWKCDCPSFTYAKTSPGQQQRDKCKHIIEAEKQHCGWHQATHAGDVKQVNSELYCPLCGNIAKAEQWGV